jgi:hypothetical protein
MSPQVKGFWAPDKRIPGKPGNSSGTGGQVHTQSRPELEDTWHKSANALDLVCVVSLLQVCNTEIKPQPVRDLMIVDITYKSNG